MSRKTEVLVIGAGPGGYVAARVSLNRFDLDRYRTPTVVTFL